MHIDLTILTFELNPAKHLFLLRDWYEKKEKDLIESFQVLDVAYVALRCRAALLSLSVIEDNKTKNEGGHNQSQFFLEASYDFIPAYVSVFIDVEKLGDKKLEQIKDTLDFIYLNIYIAEKEIYKNSKDILKKDCDFCLEIREIFSTYAVRFFSKN